MGRPKMTEQQLRESLINRFHAKRPEGAPDECWEWQGPREPAGDGYGFLGTGRNGKVWAHRLAVELAGRPAEPRQQVLHNCDNPPCCNPKHLRRGTNDDNIQDAVERGRFTKNTCRRGHPKTPENTYTRVDKRGYLERHCEVCRRERSSCGKRPKWTATHCPRGHVITLTSTYVSEGKYGQRRCRPCMAEDDLKQRASQPTR